MSLSWHKVENDWADHPKVRDLIAVLGLHYGDVYVARAWGWMGKFAPSGLIPDGARTARAKLEEAARWSGAAGVLADALVRVGLFDEVKNGLVCHDWDEVQGAFIRKSEMDAQRKRELRAARSETERRANGARRSADGARTARVDQTRLDQTILGNPLPPSRVPSAQPLALVVVEQEPGCDVTGIPVLRDVERIRWQHTADGCWEFVQLSRERKGLNREKVRPRRFPAWVQRAIGQIGPEGIEKLVNEYLGDRTIRAKNWPSGVLISQGLWDERVAQKSAESQVTASVLDGS